MANKQLLPEEIIRRKRDGQLLTNDQIQDFIDGVVPILQQKGLVQSEYSPGPLRQKIFGDPRLPSRHVATEYRK